MAVLNPADYDAFYFEGATQTYSHNAGYTSYRNQNYNSFAARHGMKLEDSTGTIFGDLIKGLNFKLTNRFIGKSVLVIGCAYGFEVEGFRSLGINAFGVDISPFAIAQAKPDIQPYLEVADIRTKIFSYSRNQFDFIFTRWFLECMSDSDLSSLIPELNRVCRSEQIHITSSLFNPEWYNSKTIQQWASLPFNKGTVLIDHMNFNNLVIV